MARVTCCQHFERFLEFYYHDKVGSSYVQQKAYVLLGFRDTGVVFDSWEETVREGGTVQMYVVRVYGEDFTLSRCPKCGIEMPAMKGRNSKWFVETLCYRSSRCTHITYDLRDSSFCQTTATFSSQDQPNEPGGISAYPDVANISERDPDWPHIRRVHCVDQKATVFVSEELPVLSYKYETGSMSVSAPKGL